MAVVRFDSEMITAERLAAELGDVMIIDDPNDLTVIQATQIRTKVYSADFVFIRDGDEYIVHKDRTGNLPRRIPIEKAESRWNIRPGSVGPGIPKAPRDEPF